MCCGGCRAVCGSSAQRRCLVFGFVHVVGLAFVGSASAHSCDRARSRLARKFLDAELYSKVRGCWLACRPCGLAACLLATHTHAQVEESGYVLPRTCPFSKEVDMYLDNENHKKEARFSNWRCAVSQALSKVCLGLKGRAHFVAYNIHLNLCQVPILQQGLQDGGILRASH